MSALRPISFLVVHGHSTENAGYAALVLATEEVLAAAGSRVWPGRRVEFTWAVNHPALHSLSRHGASVPAVVGSFNHFAHPGDAWSPARLAGVVATALWPRGPGLGSAPWRDLLRACDAADAVLSCPGGFLYSSGRVGLPLALDVALLALVRRMGKPIYLLPQSLGPLERTHDRMLVARALGWCRLAFLRDRASFDLAAALAPAAAGRLRLVPDLVFALGGAAWPGGERIALLAALDALPRPRLGVTVVNWGEQRRDFSGQAAYEQAVAQAVQTWCERGGSAVFFAHVRGPSPAEDDRRAVQRVRAYLDGPGVTYLDATALSDPHDLRAAYARLDALIGTRLHSCVLALQAGVLPLPIGYQPKTRGVLEPLGLADWVLPIGCVTSAQIVARLDALSIAGPTLRPRIAALLPILAKQARAVGTEIARDLAAEKTSPSVID